MKIRRFRDGDESALASVYNEAFKDTIKTLPEIYQYTEITPNDVKEWFKEGVTVWIAESKGNPLGYLQCRIELERGKRDIPVLQFTPATRWDLAQSNLAVLPEVRRQGIASKLIEETIEEYSDRAEFVTATVFSDNTPAENLFEKMGFTMHDAFYYSEFSDEYPLINSSIYETLELSRLVPPDSLREDITFRAATIDDAKDVVEIHKKNVWWCVECSSIKWNRQFIKSKFGHEVFVAEYDGNVVGAIDYWKDGRVGISGVLPEYRRQGIGSLMFYKVLEVMREAGFQEAFMDSGLTQKDAINMYERFGFTVQRRQNVWIRKID
jgi:ribosomal protein S18 acetylase RimI-like enzyme